MKIKIIFVSVFLFTLFSFAQNSQKPSDKMQSSRLKMFTEIDAPILVFTGGIATNIRISYKNYRLSAGFSHFNAPSKTFSGVPDGFKLRVDYILALNFDYFLLHNKTYDGLYIRFMYHNKRQFVQNKESGASKLLYSQLAGFEVGYTWKIYYGLFIAPRIGALYYMKSPQGDENKPVLIGDSYYDNKRHKVWDTYFIPTLSIGYSF